MINTFLRAKVINSKDPEKFGRVLVWIPDLMPLIQDSKGIWARAANTPIGGRNSESFDDQNFSGSCFIPPKGSWVFVFFEKGNPNVPYYITSVNLENTKVLPECQLGNYESKWVVHKSKSGRCIVISDDPKDCRVEITGRKRALKDPPTGDTDSVYAIDKNQTTILLDERDNNQKILIRTYKGDFVNVDVDAQQLHVGFSSDIHIKSGGSIFLSASDNINFTANSNINLQAVDNVNLKSDITSIDALDDINLKAGNAINSQSSGTISHKAVSTLANDGMSILDNGGASLVANSASSATEATPVGYRNNKKKKD